MSEQQTPPQASPSRGGGRGRGKSRGGLGKYLRARGRGRGGGRPAEFGKRLVLEGEGVVDLDPDSEEVKELQEQYSRRQLGSNADRYVEPGPELGSDGEEIQEPEVDLSSFLEKQKRSPGPSSPRPPEGDEDVDTSLAHITSRTNPAPQNKKGRAQQIDWDEQLDEMSREKAAAEAAWELKARFKAKSEKIRNRPVVQSQGRHREHAEEAPPLPIIQQEKNPKTEMQDFLDDLLS